MLDSDPTQPSDIQPDIDATPPSEASAPAARKRTPRKATAKAGPPPVDTAATATGDPDSEAPAPTKRAPRKAAAKSTAKRAARPAKAAEAAPEQPDAGAAVDEQPPADSDTGPTHAPAKKAPRKRAAKKATTAAPTAGAATELADEPTDTPAAAMTAPGVVFMAPAEESATAPRRRRVAKKAAGAPAPAGDPSTDATPDATASSDTAASSSTAAATDSDDTETDPDDVREAAVELATGARRRRRRGRRGRGGGSRPEDDGDEPTDSGDADAGSDRSATSGDTDGGSAGDDAAGDTANDESAGDDTAGDESEDEPGGATRRRRRRRRSAGAGDDTSSDDPPNTVTHVREKKSGNKSGGNDDDGVRGIKGSTRLEAKRQRRRDGRDTTRRRAPILTEAEFLARRESVDRVMAVRQNGDRTQIAVLEDDILVEHYVTRASSTSYVGNVYLGRVQNVLPSMEAAFVDIGKGRNGVLYAGEVNWDAAGLDGKSRTIEHAMKSGDGVLVQVTKDPIGQKGARLTSQVSLPGRFLVYVPGGGMTGISRRLPDTERHRLKSILKKIVPDEAGVIVRTAAEGASEEDLTHDVERLQAQWESIRAKSENTPGSKNSSAPALLHGEPDLAIRVVRDVFNEDFGKLVVEGPEAWSTISGYLQDVAPDLAARASRHTKDTDLFHDLRVDEQLMKALDRKVWLPSGGSLVIDRTEAMTVIDVNTGKFIGSGGNLEETVTRNNIEAAEEIVRQLRLRDVGGMVVIDFIDMVLESNRDLVLRRLTQCLGRDRTKHQVAEVTSLGLVQMTRKRVGEGLLEAFSEPCEHCRGRGVIIHSEPVDQADSGAQSSDDEDKPKGRRRRGSRSGGTPSEPADTSAEPLATPEQRQAANAAIAAIHRATAAEEAELAGAGTERAGSDLVASLATDLVAAARDAEAEVTEPAGGIVEPEVAEPDLVEAEVAEPVAEVAEAEVTEPVAEVAEAVAEPEPEPTEPEAAEPESAGAENHANGAPPAGRRRRRTASRPAGPPVTTG